MRRLHLILSHKQTAQSRGGLANKADGGAITLAFLQLLCHRQVGKAELHLRLISQSNNSLEKQTDLYQIKLCGGYLCLSVCSPLINTTPRKTAASIRGNLWETISSDA